MNKRIKSILIAVLVLLLLTAGVFGLLYARRTNQTVNVYNVSELAMTDYWGDTSTSWGQVYTDQIQTVFVSNTQEVTEVYVQPGTHVQTGDPLMAYDTTLSELELNRKELSIQEMQESLKAAKKEYNELVGAPVYTIASADADAAPDSGSMRLLPDAGAALRMQWAVPVHKTNTDPAAGENGTTDSDGTEEGTENGTDETDTTPAPEQTPPVVDGVVQTYHLVGGTGTEEDPYLYLTAVGIPFDPAVLSELIPPKEPDPDAIPDPTPPPEVYYIVFAQSEENRVDGNVIAAAGICFTESEEEDGGYLFSIFDASDRLGYELGGEPPEEETPPPDNEEEEDEEDNENEENNNSNNNSNNSNSNNSNNNNNTTTPVNPGPSYAEIQQMKAELQRQIKELDLNIRIAQVEFKRMQQEVSDGMVYAELDGVVTDVLDAETALKNGDALIKISSGGRYYVEGTVSELALDSLSIGQAVTIRSWENFGEYIGTIESIADYPSSNGGYSDGNTNVSYYPFIVSVDASADLREGEGVDMEFTETNINPDAFYLEQPFLLRENGKSYVYVTGAEGLLEKREITTGVTVWGSYVQVVAGLTLDDTIAFPYGRLIREGIQTTPSTLDELYNW